LKGYPDALQGKIEPRLNAGAIPELGAGHLPFHLATQRCETMELYATPNHFSQGLGRDWLQHILSGAVFDGFMIGWSEYGPISRAFPPLFSDSLLAKFERAGSRNDGFSLMYECSSPAVYRKFNMRVEPLPERDGFIVVHSLVVEAAFSECETNPDTARLFTDARGFIVQCASCGRVRRPTLPSPWEWVPGLVKADTENVSHGICPLCDFRMYGDDYPPP